jgi:hypothetical protein
MRVEQRLAFGSIQSAWAGCFAQRKARSERSSNVARPRALDRPFSARAGTRLFSFFIFEKLLFFVFLREMCRFNEEK